jgi:hypothetical protein
MKILDLSAAVIIGAISVAFLMMTGDLGRTAALFPKILSITIIALVLIYIGAQITIIFKNPRTESSGKEAGEKKGAAEDAPESGRRYIIIGSIVVYMGLISLIGFGAASFLFGIALPYYGGYRRMKVVIPVALGMTVGLMVIGRLFHIPLPTGLFVTLIFK